MSLRTWIVMLSILALTWGGFVATLVYAVRSESRKKRRQP
jgi:uncharacterized membrane protein